MSNATPIPVTVPNVVGTLGPGVSVQNLGASARTLVWQGASATDQGELWGSLDNVTFGQVEREVGGASLAIIFSNLTDNVTIDDDRSLFYAVRRTGGTGAASLLVTGEDVGLQLSATTNAFKARNVGAPADVPNLAAFPVAGNDAVNNVAGDVVLLYVQANPTENGPWVVGGVAAGVAPLTRPSWWPAGALMPADSKIDVAVGGTFAGTEWKAFTAAAFIVDAADPNIIPLYVAHRVALANGTATITDVPVRSATGQTQIGIDRITPVGTALTVEYASNGIVAGAIGVASVVVEAQLAGGGINAADGSLLNVSITNG